MMIKRFICKWLHRLKVQYEKSPLISPSISATTNLPGLQRTEKLSPKQTNKMPHITETNGLQESIGMLSQTSKQMSVILDLYALFSPLPRLLFKII